MNVKFYSLTSLPAAVAGAAGSFVNVTAGENAGMYYCTGDRFIRLDNVAQDRTGEINDGSVIKNGTAWGKHDIPWGWFENIVDDPTSLTLTATGGTANQAADTASEEAGEII